MNISTDNTQVIINLEKQIAKLVLALRDIQGFKITYSPPLVDAYKHMIRDMKKTASDAIEDME